METCNGLSNLRNSQPTGMPLLLPPKSASEGECFSHSVVEHEGLSEPKEGLRRHQRTYSDSMLTEEVPGWLKELLDEPETPQCRSHRRSSSDSIAYLQVEKTTERENKLTNTCVTFPSSVTSQEADTPQTHIIEKQNVADPEGSFVQHRSLYPNPSPTKTDSKRAKRHSAQQNRARKVQYIAELERSIQALQVEGYEVSTELEFLDQQNLILGMENRALKQRLDSISQEQFIKCLEQEMLEKEITRLRNLYHHQQQQHQQKQKHYGRPRSKSQELDSSFARLSLKNRGTEVQNAG
ncbi:uncharacterized protein At4g06598 [Abrus precatorius]|uniref:Uncharacterized protein At4g06598 n=1 Tax=Abrus precatorius TaxID=3816 RepID=A0A8B8KII3_ABRPR|nr:uncharacterized protein At4g06598 [Abrus precatorius]